MTKQDKINNAQALLIEEQDRVTMLQEQLNIKASEVKRLDEECRLIQADIIKGKVRVDLRKEDLEKAKGE